MNSINRRLIKQYRIYTIAPNIDFSVTQTNAYMCCIFHSHGYMSAGELY